MGESRGVDLRRRDTVAGSKVDVSIYINTYGEYFTVMELTTIANMLSCVHGMPIHCCHHMKGC